VELLAQEVSTLADNQATIVGAVGEQVHKALEAAEAGTLRVLVLVRPGLVGGEVLAVGEAVVDGVEGDNEVFGVIDFLEGGDDTGLRADVPDEVLVRGGVVQKHTLLINDGEFVRVDG
jgi:hypothetical protein